MQKSTIGHLFELLTGPTVHTESAMAELLGVDRMVLQARLVDLRKRGVLRGPVGDGKTATWKSWFPTLAATTDAAERSGLPASGPIPLPGAWWDGMWANN